MDKDLLLLDIELEQRRRNEQKRKEHASQKEYFQNNPLEYIHQVLGIRKETINWALNKEYENHKWDGDENPLMKILDSLVAVKWVGVESATGTGKTFIGALIVLWFLDCFDNSLVITTAPKQEQLSMHIWKEIGRLHSKFGKGELTHLKLNMSNDPNIKDWIAVGFVAGIKADEDSSTKAQGFHAEHLLIILEETPGVPSPIITAFENTCASPHNLILAFGNPDHQLDNLHRFCKQDNVVHVRISAFDHPHVVLDNPLFVPGAASLEGIRRIETRFGIDNPLTLSRTRGISPTQDESSLIRYEWIKEAFEQYDRLCDSQGKLNEKNIVGRYALGVDVANSEGGDKAAIARGKANVLISVKDFQCPDANQLGKRDVLTLMKENNISPDYVGIDGVGVGAGTVNALKEMNVKVLNLQSGSSAETDGKAEEYNNLRSQMWYKLREDLRNGDLAICEDIELMNDLTSPRWSVKNGKIVVESKEEIKKRLGHSPDKGDAAVYWNWARRARKKVIVDSTIL